MKHFTQFKMMSWQQYQGRLAVMRSEKYVLDETRSFFETATLRIQGLRNQTRDKLDFYENPENKNENAAIAARKILAQIDAAILREAVRLGYVRKAVDAEDELDPLSTKDPQSTPEGEEINYEDMESDELERVYATLLAKAK